MIDKESILVKDFCPNHKDRDIKYVCFDNRCSNEPRLCILCLKNTHQNCENQYIFRKNILLDRIEIKEDNFHRVKELK